MINGKVITFYSFKGGVGRSMAIANTAAALAADGKRVLLVDWDLEAPGVDLYFQHLPRSDPGKSGGLLELLRTKSINWSGFTRSVSLLKASITLLSSGRADGPDAYRKGLQDLDWAEFYRTGGGDFLEDLGALWRSEFDVTLIDSRTGLTDSGNICTIQLPDAIVIVFTANRQSLEGAIEMANSAGDFRQRLAYAKTDLTIIPLISRWDGQEEQVESAIWLDRIEEAVSPYFTRWAESTVPLRDILEQLRVPHVPYFSFGEKLAVESHSVTDQFLPGRTYVRLAALIETMDWKATENIVSRISERILSARKTADSPVRGQRKIFISAVSSEFWSYRNLLSQDLKRPNLDVGVQEDFIVTGGSTLAKLDNYIRACDGIIHLIGKATGDGPEEPAVAALLQKYPDLATKLPPLMPALSKPQPGFSYTQWEAYLAMYHDRPLFVYRPSDFELDTLDVPRATGFVVDPVEVQAQREHYQRISALGHDRGQFLNEERLSSAVLRDLVEILPRLAPSLTVPATKLRHTTERLIGREEDLARLDKSWNDQKNVVIVRSFGGMGKTALVATWMAELAMKDWRSAERVFDWSFYSQGTNDQRNASADAFVATALEAFGDPDPMRGSAWERGARLASLVGKVRCLLVLDGLEALQHPPGPMQGMLKDDAIAALLKGLSAQNAGLCVVTTRERIPDIQQHYGRTADDFALTELTDLAGAALLHDRGATRAGAREIAPDDKELQAASREVRGHVLTLQLLGQYLRLVEGGDILKRDTVRLVDADREFQNDANRPYGPAFKAMEAYEKWFLREGAQGERQLAVLRLLGLFDRPASKASLDALRNAPVIAGLTEPLVALQPRDLAAVEHRLEEIQLLAVQADGSLDTHPLLREYFGQRLRATQPEAWRAAHRRLYEHLCATTEDKADATLEDLQPLYQAVSHGCHAGMQQETCDMVYRDRILRGNENYSVNKLGAFSTDLGAVACFFETPWSRVSPAITEAAQAWLLNEAAFRLRALGRLTEALEPMRVALEMRIKREIWESASISASNLSELELTLGEVAGAVRDAEQSVTYADRSGDTFERIVNRTTLAGALQQAGRRDEAEGRFHEAEQMQAERQPSYPLLYSLWGFRYCDLLLSEAERVAGKAEGEINREGGLALCRAVAERAARTLKWAEQNNVALLDTALDHLTLGRAALYAAILESRSRQRETAQSSPPTTTEESQRGFTTAATELDHAVTGLRRAGQRQYFPPGLLTRAWLRSLTGARTGSESAQSDLDEAWEIAERGPMPLFLADIHLYRARLFFDEAKYPWQSPQHDLAEARRLIFKHGYLRRKEELEDAEVALKQFETH